MTPFREEFRSARREYQAIRYPGDLARQRLAPKMRWKNIVVFGSAGIGSIAAAAVVAALMLQPLLPGARGSDSNLPLIKNMGLANDLKFALPPLPGVPGNLSLRPLEPDAKSPSDTHIPIWDDLHLPFFNQSSEHA